MENRLRDTLFVKRSLLVAGLVLVIVYFSRILAAVSGLWPVVYPLFLGLVIAYVVNLPMTFFERHYFPNTRRVWVRRSRRPVCLLLAFALFVLLIVVVINLVLPQVVETIQALGTVFPGYIERITAWFEARQSEWPSVAAWLESGNVSLESISGGVMSYASQGISGIVQSSVGLIGAMASGVFNLLIALALSVYLLVGKENIVSQLKRLGTAFMKQQHRRKLSTVLSVADESFASFITGQCIEAVILGALCMLGMWIFGFPYATPIGIFVGVTSLIPVFGAYLGAAVGVLLIFPTAPLKALLFVVFIIVLQQLEGNLIYPKVVGTSIGLPGIWVFVAVIVGGGLGGIVGMLFGVPVAATFYKLLRRVVQSRDRRRANTT